MPDTLQWRELVNVIRDREGMPLELYDQYDAIMRDWTAPLGLTLDRATLEGAVWGISFVLAMTAVRQVQQFGVLALEHSEPTAEQLTQGIALVQYLLVQRIDALEAEQ